MGGLSLLGDGETVRVEKMEIQNETVYKFFEEIEEEEREEALQKALLIGCVAMRRMTVAEDMDYIEKEFTRFMGKMSKDVDEMFNIEIEGSHLHKLAKVLEEYFDEGGTMEELLDCTEQDSPLYKMKEEIKKEITDLRNDLFKKKGEEEVIDLTTIKGYDFEDVCEERLQEIARPFGDEVERTSTERGDLEGRVVGDFVITLNEKPDLKIVLETKDWGSVTLPKIRKNLEEAMENRSAEYGIFLIKNKEALPKMVGYFNEYPGNQLVAVYGVETEDGNEGELLEIAYKWARTRLLYQKGEVTGVDLTRVGNRLEEISASMKNFTNILKQCKNVEKANDKIRKLCGDIRDEISSSMDEIWEELKRVQGEE
ncbi:MAG: hypothetical protein E3J35_09445 [Methanomassiliicoccales archaeon]|nr:MAG: hypothetical protein E3J35_09445 [Methanomassiliicoccales archaeon]